MRYNINPFPAVRSNKNSWSKRTQDYHTKMNTLRCLINVGEYTKVEIMEALIEGSYELIFMIEMPKSWSQKKKDKFDGQPHRATPDIDNIFKAFTDTVFYQQKDYNDSGIYKMHARKYRGKEGIIEFNIRSGVK